MLTLRRMMGWLMLSFLTAVLIIGCGLSGSNNSGEKTVDASPQLSNTDCRVLAHDLGETEVCGQPQNVAVLGVHSLDLLLSLDVQPVGYAASNAYAGEVFDNPAQQIPYLGQRLTTQPVSLGRGGEPSLEKLTALKPDLIVGEASRSDNYDLLTQIAPTLQWQNRMAKGQWQESLQTIAAALGQDEKAEAVIQQYEDRIADARADLADVVAAYPKLLLLGANRLDEGAFVISADSYLGELLSGVGFQFVSPANATDTAPISIEALSELNDADTIIILGYDFDASNEQLENSNLSDEASIDERLETQQMKSIKQDWEANAIAQSLTASQADRVYFATFYKWNGLNGAIGAELILKDLRQFLLE
ncbi:MAG: iron-siderophore ABC transporter substrate-binding protein [Leptolyngbya sp. SIOISBB]|nr:iron-siderophore ABC transporter substrate-binding protein [Leptolyngbya sp. SIOISBB]